jgi:hypothetical protein
MGPISILVIDNDPFVRGVFSGSLGERWLPRHLRPGRAARIGLLPAEQTRPCGDGPRHAGGGRH